MLAESSLATVIGAGVRVRTLGIILTGAGAGCDTGIGGGAEFLSLGTLALAALRVAGLSANALNGISGDALSVLALLAAVTEIIVEALA